MKGRAGNGGQTRREWQAYQTAATLKSIGTDRSDAGRNRQACQAAATMKGRSGNGCQTRREWQACQAAASLKSVVTDRSDTGRNRQVGQATAVLKSRNAYGGNTGRERQTGQAAASFKCQIAKCVVACQATIGIIVASTHNFCFRQIQSHKFSASGLSIEITTGKMADKPPVSSVYLADNLQTDSFTVLGTSYFIMQRTSLGQLDRDLLRMHFSAYCFSGEFPPPRPGKNGSWFKNVRKLIYIDLIKLHFCQSVGLAIKETAWNIHAPTSSVRIRFKYGCKDIKK